MITDKKNNKGFTLAEVLVTIGILGVIAAVLIPVVNKAVPDKNKIMFKKAYNTLEKAVDSLINDEYLYPSSKTYQISTTGIYTPSGFNYVTDDIGDAGTKNKFCYYFSQKLDLVGEQTCPLASASSTATITKFATTADGIDWYFRYGAFDTDTTTGANIIVDVNGSNKKPNCCKDGYCSAISLTSYITGATCSTTCSDPDIFVLRVDYKGKVYVGIGDGYDTNAENILKNPLKNIK